MAQTGTWTIACRRPLDPPRGAAHNELRAAFVHEAIQGVVMSDRALALVLSNDSNPTAARLSRHYCLALNRLGIRTVARDTRLVRWGASVVAEEGAARSDAFETAVVAKWERLADDYGIDTVISLDLDWLISPRLFLPSKGIREIHSFWFENLASESFSAAAFNLIPNLSAQLNHPKVTHHCDEKQAEKLRDLGVERTLVDLPSAVADKPEEEVARRENCLRKIFS